jgi:hypothetical protein
LKLLPDRIALLVLFAFASCTSTPPEPVKPGHAACPVCQAEGDLACVDVAVEGDTPRAEIGKRTYYFCSESCRCDFEKCPSKYLPR